jgi:hypothetical protein
VRSASTSWNCRPFSCCNRDVVAVTGQHLIRTLLCQLFSVRLRESCTDCLYQAQVSETHVEWFFESQTKHDGCSARCNRSLPCCVDQCCGFLFSDPHSRYFSRFLLGHGAIQPKLFQFVFPTFVSRSAGVMRWLCVVVERLKELRVSQMGLIHFRRSERGPISLSSASLTRQC